MRGCGFCRGKGVVGFARSTEFRSFTACGGHDRGRTELHAWEALVWHIGLVHWLLVVFRESLGGRIVWNRSCASALIVVDRLGS